MTADGTAIDDGLLDELRQQLGDDVVREIADEFLAGNRDILDILFDTARTATDRGDAAHSLKGSCASIGLAGAAALCRSLELAFRESRLDQQALSILRATIDQGLLLIAQRLTPKSP